MWNATTVAASADGLNDALTVANAGRVRALSTGTSSKATKTKCWSPVAARLKTVANDTGDPHVPGGRFEYTSPAYVEPALSESARPHRLRRHPTTGPLTGCSSPSIESQMETAAPDASLSPVPDRTERTDERR